MGYYDDGPFEDEWDFPPPFTTELEPIGSYGMDNGHCFEFEVDHTGFTVTRHFGPVSAYDCFTDLGFWPDYVFWRVTRKRLGTALKAIPKTRLKEDVDSIMQRISWHYGGVFSKYLEEENETKDKDLPKLWEKWEENLEVSIRIGPVTCPEVSEPEYCGLEIWFEPGLERWIMTLAEAGDIPSYDFAEQTGIIAPYFDEILFRKEEIELHWPDDKIIRTLCKADKRWRKFIKKKRPEPKG